MEELISFNKVFDQKLLDFVEKEQEKAYKLEPLFLEAILEIKRLIKAGGKRLRPFLAYKAFKAYQGKSKNIWSACLSLELIHCFALIHDDIMDKPFLRRGEKTCFRKLGLNKALLVGDLALSLADQLSPSEAKEYFSKLKLEMIAGQWLDITSFKPQNIKEKLTLKIITLKTSDYTFSRPLQIGGVLAGAGQTQINFLNKLGCKLGFVFQIQDDILDAFGNKKRLGKNIGQDIKSGKKTLLLAYLIQTLNKTKDRKLKKNLIKKLGGLKLSQKDFHWIKSLMVELGVLEKARAKAKLFKSQAKEEIFNLKISKKDKEFFIQLTDNLLEREK
ncbi:hypothetical protein COT75_02540 [Candidatus Beckwithbacteria bacterium CG10_big_fil_rev_8_21_14_0_10_34_10]|uniref:Polyprenyl synthetase family protein n=1 Tax=Candidatus Beckwithbacteria bacterium CG10_big_fil_rev_8_21_14_0_10_34_10 TaxID=1974495 RepID=A0A2H0W990_9BACT|nr:MAG: hypothetical protein COT75_02540 [Candidatus Beckwithbacteria bacterium CG10_big_fil_rev_8_21_14_0_10_34_10]